MAAPKIDQERVVDVRKVVVSKSISSPIFIEEVILPEVLDQSSSASESEESIVLISDDSDVLSDTCIDSTIVEQNSITKNTTNPVVKSDPPLTLYQKAWMDYLEQKPSKQVPAISDSTTTVSDSPKMVQTNDFDWADLSTRGDYSEGTTLDPYAIVDAKMACKSTEKRDLQQINKCEHSVNLQSSLVKYNMFEMAKISPPNIDKAENKTVPMPSLYQELIQNASESIVSSSTDIFRGNLQQSFEDRQNYVSFDEQVRATDTILASSDDLLMRIRRSNLCRGNIVDDWADLCPGRETPGNNRSDNWYTGKKKSKYKPVTRKRLRAGKKQGLLGDAPQKYIKQVRKDQKSETVSSSQHDGIEKELNYDNNDKSLKNTVLENKTQEPVSSLIIIPGKPKLSEISLVLEPDDDRPRPDFNIRSVDCTEDDNPDIVYFEEVDQNDDI